MRDAGPERRSSPSSPWAASAGVPLAASPPRIADTLNGRESDVSARQPIAAVRQVAAFESSKPEIGAVY